MSMMRFVEIFPHFYLPLFTEADGKIWLLGFCDLNRGSICLPDREPFKVRKQKETLNTN